MAVHSYQELQDVVSKCCCEDELYRKICKNIKNIRKEKYEEFKNTFNSNSINPYTTENIAALLDYSHTHYKRFESDTDSTKKIPLIKIVLLALIFDVDIDKLLK